MPERGERGKPELCGRVDRLSRPIGLFGYFVCLTDSFALLTQSGIEPLGFNLQLITMRSRAGDRRQSNLCLSLARRWFNLSLGLTIARPSPYWQSHHSFFSQTKDSFFLTYQISIPLIHTNKNTKQ